MSNTDRTCEYVLDPDDPETWGGEDGDECYVDEEVLDENGLWTCPHDAEEGDDLCIFHLPVNNKNNEEITDILLELLNEATNSTDSKTQRRQLQFIGAKFNNFNISLNIKNNEIDDNILMEHIIVRNKLDWSDTDFNNLGVSICGMKCNTGDFERAIFGGEFNSKSAEFKEHVSFYRTEFGGSADFRNVVFDRGADFFHTEFRGEVDFRQTEFGGNAMFSNAEFQNESVFQYSTFRKKGCFSADGI